MYEECFCRTKVGGYGLSEAFVTVGKIMARLRWPRTPQAKPRVADFFGLFPPHVYYY